MVHRRDLVPRFEWLAGSPLYDDLLDEVLVAIAFAARGLSGELLEYGAAWVWADYVVDRFGLQDLVERARADLEPFVRIASDDDADPST